MLDTTISRRSLLASAGLGLAAPLALAGCSSSEAPAGSGSTSTDKVTVTFWHSAQGTILEALDALVADYNAQSDTYHVEAVFQGDYNESVGKFLSMAGGSGAPSIIQIGEQNLQAMIDSGLIVPLTDLIEKHGFDDSDLIEQVANFFTVDDVLYALPFNCSSPVVYYNKEVLAAAGADEFPATFEAVSELADAIAAADPSLKPMGMHAYGYALDEMVTNLGSYVVNNKNGRAARATEVAYEEDMRYLFNWIASLIEKDQLVNYGSDGSSATSGFSQRQSAFFIHSSAITRKVVDACEFEVGVAPLPCREGADPQGVYGGGGAFCIPNGLSEDVEAGVMDFCAYAVSADAQAKWADGTGYCPVSAAALETEAMQATYESCPQMKVSADQLRGSKVNDVTAGPLCSQLPQLRTDLQTALESVFNGGDVDQALKTAQESTNAAIASANQGVA